jgi:hypothetical protein
VSHPEIAAHAAARTLAADAVIAEVASALAEHGVRSILLKGPSLVGWLYRYDEGRLYGDADLLVGPDQYGEAEAVLTALGFELEPAPAGGEYPIHARPWMRARDGGKVDLHRTLAGVRIAPEEAWAILVHETEPLEVMGTRVQALAPAARTLMLALHAAHHRAEPDSGIILKPLRDLELALERLPTPLWAGAAELATRLHCRERLSSALHETPRGEALARSLRLPSGEWARHGSATQTAAAFERLQAVSGMGARARMAAGMLLPSPARLRWQSELARHGRPGLVAAYLLRPFRLLLTGIPGLVDWLRLRRRQR